MDKSYLPAFKHLAENAKDSFRLIGDCLLVEEMPKEEYKTQSGLIIASSINARQVDSIEDNRPMLVRVLLVGEGYYDDETKTDVPLDVAVGDIILVGKLSVKWLSSIGPVLLQEGSRRVGLVRETDIQWKYFGQEGYEKVGKILEEGLKL